MALTLVALSTALVMAPAAYHREVEPQSVSERFMRLSTRLLLLSMFPLAAGICVDFYLIARIILQDRVLSAALALILLGLYLLLWLLLPRLYPPRARR